MIRRNPSGAFYCDGRECGYELQRCAGDDEHHDEIVCLDCGSAMYVAPLPSPDNTNPKAGAPEHG